MSYSLIFSFIIKLENEINSSSDIFVIEKLQNKIKYYESLLINID